MPTNAGCAGSTIRSPLRRGIARTAGIRTARSDTSLHRAVAPPFAMTHCYGWSPAGSRSSRAASMPQGSNSSPIVWVACFHRGSSLTSPSIGDGRFRDERSRPCKRATRWSSAATCCIAPTCPRRCPDRVRASSRAASERMRFPFALTTTNSWRYQRMARERIEAVSGLASLEPRPAQPSRRFDAPHSLVANWDFGHIC